jgi:hypothetical protein
MSAKRENPPSGRRIRAHAWNLDLWPTALRNARGQVLVLVALGMVALLGMVAIVVDGGNAWVQQRGTQNGTDSAAEAGAVVLVQMFGGAPMPTAPATWDGKVKAAVQAAASSGQNNLTSVTAYYTDVSGNLLTTAGATTTDVNSAAKVGGVTTIPTGAAGVEALGIRTFSTYFAGVVGLANFTTPASATAVAGALTGESGGPIMPVTFPETITTCSGNSSLIPGTAPWVIIDPNATPTQVTPATESIVPLCNTAPGSVGWLDLGGGQQNLEDEITNPTTTITVPGWFQTKTGNANNVDTALNTLYDGKQILLPLFDGTCKNQPGGPSLSSCANVGTGTGNTTWYHIPYLDAFLLGHAYIQGNNFPDCNSDPGQPYVGGNGKTGCLKGWFVKGALSGTVTGIDSGTPAAAVLGVQLIK